MAVNLSPIYLPGDEVSKITKWHVKTGARVGIGKLLLTYEEEESKTKHKLKCEVVGTVQEILAKEGHVMPPGSMLLQIRGCEHPIVMKDMCAECGADLREDGGRPGLRTQDVSASVAMVHCVPELIISEQHALEIGKADEQRLQNSRKLVLLVDLDQTLLHTTNDNIPPNLKDVYHFQLLHNDSMMWYHTKFRPGTEKFLENISKLYEMHICTFGVRMYAHTIARFIDPDGKLFSHRILSRDECFNATSKTANLKALFPCGDAMVVIIDDREDVWNFAKNLIHVKPYHFFVGTADINAPPGLGKDEDDAKTEAPHVKDQKEKDKTDKEQSTESETSEAKSDQTPMDQSNTETNEKLSTDEKSEDKEVDNAMEVSTDDTSAVEDKTTDETIKDDGSNGEKGKEYNNNKKTEEKEDMIEWEDNDDYLTHLEEILTTIHKAYYDVCDEIRDKTKPTSEVPNLKNILPYVKKKTLKGCNIVFSGVFPLNTPPEKSREYHIARYLGANVQSSFVPMIGDNVNATTHLVAARMGTDKVKLAQKSGNVHIVTPEWLAVCSHRWERVDERLFLLSNSAQAVGTRDNKSPDVSQLRKDESSAKRKFESSERGSENDTRKNNGVGVKRTKVDPRTPTKTTNQVKDDATQTGLGKVNPAGSSESVFADTEAEISDESSQTFARSFNPLYSFSTDDLEDMDKEVEEILDSESDEDDTEKAEKELRRRVISGDEESDSSSGESLSGEYPKGWKRKHEKKRKSRDDDKAEIEKLDKDEGSMDSFKLGVGAGSSSDESDYAESIGSVDEEMAAEVEKLISRQTPF